MQSKNETEKRGEKEAEPNEKFLPKYIHHTKKIESQRKNYEMFGKIFLFRFTQDFFLCDCVHMLKPFSLIRFD